MSTVLDTLITADMLLTQNANRDILPHAAIGIKDGRIAVLGPQKKYGELPAVTTLHLGNTLLMPGLINGHTHAAMTFFRGLADDLPLMQWLTQHIFPVEQHLTADIVHLATLLGCAEMTRTGTTAFSDMYLLEQAVCTAADKAGMKVLAGEAFFTFPSPAYANSDEAFALIEEQIAAWKGHPRVRIAITPHAVYTTTPAQVQTCHALARKHGLPLHIHLAETPTETATCLTNFNKRPVAYLHDLGLLDKHTTIAHGVDLTEEELGLLAATGVRIVHNPKSNMKLASGIAPVAGMLRHGMLPGLGTDGAASNNTLNMFGEMTTCALLHKVAENDPTALPASTVLDMATLGSAAALGWEEMGTLATGGPADLIALDLNAPNLEPMYNPVSHLVYAASGHEVTLTMVDGQILYQDGRHLTIDYPLVQQEMRKIKKWVLQKKA